MQPDHLRFLTQADLTQPGILKDAIDAAEQAQADAAASAQAAQDAANLVGAPAGNAIDAYLGGDAGGALDPASPASKRLVTEAALTDPASAAGAYLNGTYALKSEAGGGARVDALPSKFIMAHRGGNGVAPEHTIAAYDLAIAQGAHAIELDVYLLADGVPAVHHDSDVTRTTNGTGTPGDYTSQGWKNLVVDSATWFSGGWPNQGAPLLLGEVLARYGNRVVFIIELKTVPAALNTAVETMVRQFGLVESVILGSTNYSVAAGRAANGFHAYYDDPTGTSVAPATIAAAGIEFLCMNGASAATIDAMHAAGIKTVAYTINRQKDMATWTARNSDGILTDQVLYVNGVANGYQYRKTTAPWVKDGRIPPLLHFSQGGASGEQVGIVGTPGAYRLQPASTHKSAILQAWACPLANAAGSYTLTVPFTIDVTDSDASSSVGVYFGNPDDTTPAYNLDVPGNGWLCMIRQSGSLQVYKVTNGVGTSVGTGPTAAIPAGGSATVTVQVTPTAITFTRTDSGGFPPITITDSAYRGAYWHLRANTKNAGIYSFGAVTVS